MNTCPALSKKADGLKFRPFWMVNVPLLVARLATLRKTELTPSRRMVALLVDRTVLPAIVRVELAKTCQVPPVSVLPLRWKASPRASVPDRTCTVPRLLNAKLTSVMPAPPDLRKVPVARLLKVGVAPSRRFRKSASD